MPPTCRVACGVLAGLAVLALSQAPLPPAGRPVEQTYAPPRPQARPAGQPMMLNSHAIY